MEYLETKKAHLELIVGPMFAGKSCELLRRIRMQQILNKKYIIVKPSIDTRHSDKHIVTHNFDKMECLVVENLSELLNSNTIDSIDIIFIDEGQFFIDLKDISIKLIEQYNITVVISGLIGDFNRNKFGQILDLFPYCDCDKITFLNALCIYCMDGTLASFSLRKNVFNPGQILIGASDSYASVCRKHYLESQTN